MMIGKLRRTTAALDVRQEVHAVGGQCGLAYVPWNAALNFHAFYKFSAVDRLQGAAYGISFAIKF